MLDKITIKNFQSMVNFTYDFCPGLNVIIADNNIGKSIIFKVIEVLVNGHKFNSDERREYIRFGTNKADIFIYSDGYIYWAEILPTKTNYYSGTSLSNLVYEGNELPNGLRQALGLLICEDGLIGNIIDDNQSKFLINSDAKVNNSILGLLTREFRAEKIIDVLTERIKSLNADIRVKSSEKTILSRELSNIKVVDIAHRESIANDSNVLLTLSDIFIGISEKLSNINVAVHVNKDAKVLLDIADNLQSISNKVKGVNSVKPFPVNYDTLDFISNLQGLSNRLKSVNDVKLPSEVDIKTIETLNSFYPILNKILKLQRENKVLDIESKRLKMQLDKLQGEVYDCPIHGSIKFVNGKECVPYHN